MVHNSRMAVRHERDASHLRFWSIWLQCACWGMALFGLLLVGFHTRALPGLTEALSRSLWATEKLPDEVVRYHRFVHAVLGSVMAAWGSTLAWVTRRAFSVGDRWAWRCVATSVGVWFVLDTASSVFYGVWPNVWLNLLSVAPFLPPLLFTWRRF
jgi:hypothetical protein